MWNHSININISIPIVASRGYFHVTSNLLAISSYHYNRQYRFQDCVHTMPAHFENGENCDGSKTWASVHTIPAQFENGRKFDGKTRCKTLRPKKCTYTLRMDQSRSKSVEKCFVYIIFECSHVAVSNSCRLGLRFQNLPFSKFAGKKCAAFVSTCGLSVTFFTVFRVCRHRVNAVQIFR